LSLRLLLQLPGLPQALQRLLAQALVRRDAIEASPTVRRILRLPARQLGGLVFLTGRTPPTESAALVDAKSAAEVHLESWQAHSEEIASGSALIRWHVLL